MLYLLLGGQDKNLMAFPNSRYIASWGSGIFVGMTVAGCLYDGAGQLVWLVIAAIFAALAISLED